MTTAVLAPDLAPKAKRKSGELRTLRLDEIRISPDNPRRDVGDVAELAQSIKAQGLIQPIIVTPDGGGYLLLAGHRRFAAVALAGLTTVEAVVRTLNQQERLAGMLVENLQRVDLQPLEEAAALRRLVDEFGMNQRTLGDTVGRSQGHISKRLALLDLPKNVQAALDSGGITLADALELTKLKAMPKRLAAAFAQGTHWRGQYARAVADQIDEHETAEKIGKATQELKQTGIKVVASKSLRYLDLPSGVVDIGGWEARELKLTVANHKNQPCHAAAIDPRNGSIVYVCTKPASHKGKKLETPADEQEKSRKVREAEKRAQLRAREKNIELGQLLATKLASPKIDARNMRLIADLLMYEMGAELGHATLRFTDEASQTVVTRKDGQVSRIVHVDGTDATQILHRRLREATTAEEIMGVLLQILLTVKLVDRTAVPASNRYSFVSAIDGGGTVATRIKKTIDAIAAGIGKSTRARSRAAS